jgi:hypothetical protein
LNSSDSLHDFSLSLGQTVGFLIRVCVDGKWYDLSAWGLGKLNEPLSFASYIVASPGQEISYEPFLALLLIIIVFLVILIPYKKSFDKPSLEF